MKLLISEASEHLIEDFVKSVCGKVDYASSKDTIRALHISIIFFQPERYSRRLNCEFKFSPDVSFFYQDICAAFLSYRAISTDCSPPGDRDAHERELNDDYVAEVIHFCKVNWTALIVVPPHWYEKAVEISDKNIRSNFPDIADEDLGNKIRLLNAWRKQ